MMRMLKCCDVPDGDDMCAQAYCMLSPSVHCYERDLQWGGDSTINLDFVEVFNALA